MTRLQQQLEEQCASNASGLPHFDDFAEHREHVTRLIAGGQGVPAREREPTGEGERGARVCVLGAGNGYDLDLAGLLRTFQELHLVDIDAQALARAQARVPEQERGRVLLHAPLDASGIFHELERWGQMQVTLQELIVAPAEGAKRIARALPGPFDVVASSCLLTQLQLTLLEVIGDRHPLFVALRELLTLTHLRTLAALTQPGGRALLITDLCEGAVFPPGRPQDEADVAPLMRELVDLGHVIHSSHPALIQLPLTDDPVLVQKFDAAEQSQPWIWQNGPDRRFLCYALTLPRK